MPARRIAANIAKLPGLVKRSSEGGRGHPCNFPDLSGGAWRNGKAPARRGRGEVQDIFSSPIQAERSAGVNRQNGRRLLRIKLRHLSEVIVHAGFDDVLTLCDRSRYLCSGKSSQSRPGERGVRPYRGIERARAKVDVVIFQLRRPVRQECILHTHTQ